MRIPIGQRPVPKGPTSGLNLALVGFGAWGRKLFRALGQVATARVVAVCDMEPGAPPVVGGKALRITRNYRHLLGNPDIDAMVVATPPETHAEMAIAALKSGYHVFVEKPMALSSAEADALLRQSLLTRRLLMVGHILHYNPAYQQLMNWCELRGPVRRSFSFRSATATRPPAWDVWWALAPHDVSVALALFGAVPAAMSLHRSATSAVAKLYFQTGGIAEIWVALCGSADRARHTSVFLDKAAAHIDEGRGELTVASHSLYELPDTLLAAQAVQRTLALRTAGGLGFGEEPLVAELRAFCEAACHGRSVPTDVSEGARVVAVLEAGEASARAGGIRVPLRAGIEAARVPEPLTELNEG